MHTYELPQEYALVLQQINEDGEEDFATLADTLSFERSRLAHIVEALKNKGLISMGQGLQAGAWMRLTSKGRQLMNYLWPESGLRMTY